MVWYQLIFKFVVFCWVYARIWAPSAVRYFDFIRGVPKSSVNSTRKQKKTEHTNKLTFYAFKIIAILHNTQFATFIKLLETLSKDLFRNRSQNRCHTLLDCRHVCKTWAFHDAVQAGKQKEVHPPYSPDLAPAGDVTVKCTGQRAYQDYLFYLTDMCEDTCGV
jgi:hypothetical protein